MLLVTAEQMRKMDRHAIDTIGLPAAVLMENAGRAVAEEVLLFAGEHQAVARPWLVLVGKGNNGGDGIVAARHLIEAGIGAELLYAVAPEQLEGEAALQRDIAARMGIPARQYQPGGVDWRRYAGVVDGLLGTGTAGAPREPYASLIREANACGLPVIAIDIPSGLNADTGEVHDPCIRARLTVTLAFCKSGLVQYPGAAYAGRIIVRSIGIPAGLADLYGADTWLATRETIGAVFGLALPLERPADGHKGTFGHALVIAGSGAYEGAGLLAAKAALRAGAGLVTWALPQTVARAMAGRLPEAILAGVADDGDGNWTAASAGRLTQLAESKKSAVIGPGIARFSGDAEWLRQLWTDLPIPLVLDADALNILADSRGLSQWPSRRATAIITPHPGEMARLTGMSVPDIQRDRIGAARTLAVRHGVIVVLKGARTVTALPDGRSFVNPTGNSGMGTGGTGDVLAGLLAGLLAQGLPPEAAAVAGVFLHGEAGDRAAENRPSPASLLAGDILDAL
jgi:NAD(P)H-hydrate epimerase